MIPADADRFVHFLLAAMSVAGILAVLFVLRACFIAWTAYQSWTADDFVSAASSSLGGPTGGGLDTSRPFILYPLGDPCQDMPQHYADLLKIPGVSVRVHEDEHGPGGFAGAQKVFARCAKND